MAHIRFHTKRLLTILSVAALVPLFAACRDLTGSPCGGGVYGSARTVLPDTGLNAGAEVLAVLTQHGTNEETEFAVWQLWPAPTDFRPDVVRMRMTNGEGVVLLDTTALTFRSGSAGAKSGFLAFGWIRNAIGRNAWYEAISNNQLWIELWKSSATAPATRVRVLREDSGVEPILNCV